MSRYSATYDWALLVIGINLYWILYDFAIAKQLGWRTMTDQFQRWLREPIPGPMVIGFVSFVISAFLFHMFVRSSS